MSTNASANSAVLAMTGRDCVRSARIERHCVVGGIALLSATVLLDHLNGPATFLVFVVAVGATVSSFARAVDAGFGQFYGWLYGEPLRLTAWDAVIYRIVHRRRHGERKGSAISNGPPIAWTPDSADFGDSRVRVLTITGSDQDP